jgi:parvulin-like peptidyl-prolyl isomerase
MRLVVACLAFCALMQGVTVDSLAIAVGSTVITELQIDEDLRVAALLNGQPVVRDVEARRAAADRLVGQLLIQHEIEISRYPLPSAEEVDTLYASVEKTMGGAERLKELLEKYSVTQQTLRAHLMAQLSTLRFIEFRFRPDVNVSDSDIEAVYQRELTQMHDADPTVQLPILDASKKAQLSERLEEERTDAALNSWLAESRKQVNIRYIDTSLQ